MLAATLFQDSKINAFFLPRKRNKNGVAKLSWEVLL
jgi:hypothetical protein